MSGWAMAAESKSHLEQDMTRAVEWSRAWENYYDQDEDYVVVARTLLGLIEQVETAQQEASDMRKAAAGMSADLTRFGTAMVEAQDHLRPSHAAYRILGAALNPASEPTEGLPPDLARILRDPSITIDRDHEIRLADGRTLFEHLQEWRNAPSNTASAHVETETTPDASSVSTPASGRDVGHRPSPPGTNITGDGTGETLPPIVEVGEQPLRTSNPASTPKEEA